MKAFLIFFITGFNLSISAQSNKQYVVKINVSENEKELSLPFSGIKIIDARFDKTNVGCVATKASFEGITELKEEAIFPYSIELYLPDILQSHILFDSSSSDSLVLLLKEFRITDYLINEINWNKEPQSLLRISASFFCLKDNIYHKLFSLQDILSEQWSVNKKSLSKKNIPALRSEALTRLLLKIFDNKPWISSPTYYSSPEVLEGIKKRFSLPVLTSTSMKPGLYRTFEEFKMNTPAESEINILQKSHGTVEIRNKEGQLINLENYWGISDSKGNYIIFRNNLCPLIRSGQSFKFLSYRNLQDLHKKADFGSMVTSMGLIPALLNEANPSMVEYFYLSMDTGEIYLEELLGKSGLKALQKELLK